MKNEKKAHVAKFFNKFKHPHQMSMICFFSDEKNFCQDQMVNTQNNRGLALPP